MAGKVFSATTAMPPNGWKTDGMDGLSIDTTLSTFFFFFFFFLPGTFMVSAASKDFTLPAEDRRAGDHGKG